jgi:hypothetical protein
MTHGQRARVKLGLPYLAIQEKRISGNMVELGGQAGRIK